MNLYEKTKPATRRTSYLRACQQNGNAWHSPNNLEEIKLAPVGSAGSILAQALSRLGALGAAISVEKEWTQALCGADSAALARLNAGCDHKSFIEVWL